jgi:hypothetical protein
MTAMCMTACSSDDDDNTSKPKEVNLPTPKNVENAAQYVLTTPKVAVGVEEDSDAPQLQTIDITESCELLLELRHPISKQIQYFKEKATLNGNVYTVNGQNVKGTVKVLGDAARATRSGTTNLEVNLEVKYTETEVYKYTTDDGTMITTIVEKPLTADEALARLSRTWNILGVILKLDSEDVDVSERWEAKNGVLNLETTVLKEALDQGVNLTADEQAELKKTVKGISITASGKRSFSIEYTNANPDVATWEWADAGKTKISIKLRDGKMGNKFIQDASQISFDFNGDRCNMKMVTTFKDNSNKKWDVELIVQTRAAAE